MNDELAHLARIGIDAGLVILKLREKLTSWEHKQDGSPVTVADRASEDLVIERLAELAPGTPVMAEERISSGETVPRTSDRFFLVDALDGTRDFVKGRNSFTVNVGLIENGRPVLGIIIAPAMGEGFAADASGAFRFEVRDGRMSDVHAIRARSPGKELHAVVSQSHPSPETMAYLDRHAIRTRKSYGSSLKLCRLAEGRADIYPRLARTMEWDIAAGDAILRRAGGSVRTLDGQLMQYGKMSSPEDVALANPFFLAFGAWTDDEIAHAMDL